jgi:hypothetical protein
MFSCGFAIEKGNTTVLHHPKASVVDKDLLQPSPTVDVHRESPHRLKLIRVE